MRVFYEGLVFAGVLGQGVFLAMFVIGSRPMLKQPLGIVLITDAIGLFLSLATIAAFYIWGDYRLRPLVGLAAFGLVIAGIFLRVAVYYRLRWGASSTD